MVKQGRKLFSELVAGLAESGNWLGEPIAGLTGEETALFLLSKVCEADQERQTLKALDRIAASWEGADISKVHSATLDKARELQAAGRERPLHGLVASLFTQPDVELFGTHKPGAKLAVAIVDSIDLGPHGTDRLAQRLSESKFPVAGIFRTELEETLAKLREQQLRNSMETKLRQ